MPVRYHEAIAQVGLPLILFQLQPALAGLNFEPDTLRAMAAVDGVVAIKEASFDARRFVDTARLIAELPRPITLLTGNDNFILESFMLGATGALIGFGAVMTREQVDMIEAWNDGRIEDARALGRRVQRLADVVFAPPVGDYRVRLKECLRILGVLEAAHVRRPLHADSATRSEPSSPSVLAEVGLLDRGRRAASAATSPDREGLLSRLDASTSPRAEESAMATEPADVLIIGAGASGGVVGAPAGRGRVLGRLPRAGRLARPRRLPGQQARLGAQGAQGLGDQPEHPRARRGLPDRRGRHARSRRSCTTRSAARRSSSPAPGRARCRPTSASARSTASPTTGRSTTSSCCPYFYRTDRQFGVSGLPGDPAYPPDAEDAPMPPLPIGAAGLKVARGAHEARLALVAGVQLDQFDAVRRPPAVRPAEHLPVGLQRGRQGVDRPDPLAQGDRPRRAARDRRPRPPDRDRRAGPGDRRDLDRRATAPSISSRRRSSSSRPTRSARRGCCCCRRARPTPTVWRTRRASSGSG